MPSASLFSLFVGVLVVSFLELADLLAMFVLVAWNSLMHWPSLFLLFFYIADALAIVTSLLLFPLEVFLLEFADALAIVGLVVFGIC